MPSLPCQRSHRAIGALSALLLYAAACGAEATPGNTTSTSGSGGGGPASVCASDPRAEVYAVGLENKAADGAVKIRFMDSLPAPPAKGNNTWKVALLDASDKPITDAVITTTGYMPDHKHGSSSKLQSTSMGASGTYEITPMNLFMPGIWEITMSVQPTAGAAEPVVFTFCIDG